MEKGFKISETERVKPIDKEMIQLADQFGYKAIAVCCYDEAVKETEYWANKRSGVKFIAGEPDKTTKYKGTDSTDGKGWPAVWRIVDKLGGSAGCGNSHQKQLNLDHPYSEVSYRKIDGEWYVFNTEKIINQMSKKYDI
jgi:hypothetical protein